MAAALLGASCAAAATVEVERAEPSRGELRADGRVDRPVAADDTTGAPSDPVPTPAGSIDWETCDDFGIPEWVTDGTGGWECGRLRVAMDPFGSTPGRLPAVELAVTRHRATGTRAGAIVLNPGGPGAAGLPTAWGVRPVMPTELLRAFDIVSWDPRGVGQSMPRADCGDADSFEEGFIAACVEATGPLSAHLSAPYSSADMEALRDGLGEETLDYLGFSYGSILGANYAARYPDRVGAFVLDGVTDPLAGSADGPFEDGFPVFADDGRPAALERLAELCSLTERCLPDAEPAEVLDDLPGDAPDLPTDAYQPPPDVVFAEDVELVLDLALTYAGDWELLATALGDAVAGDGSALAALVSIGDDVVAGDQEPPGDALPDNFSAANYLIYCADFGPLITSWSFCDDMPVNAEPLTAVVSVDIDRPMLIVGTEYDPLTPGKHAPEFAAAIGDAVHIIWDGVGHTAFPGWTDCIDDAVARQFLRERLPPDGTRCSMIAETTDDAELAEELFGFDPAEAVGWLTDVFAGSGAPLDPACAADSVVPADPAAIDDRLLAHVILGVDSPEATAAVDNALATC